MCMKKLMICILCLASIPCFAQFRVGVQGSFSSIGFWSTDRYTGYPSTEFIWEMNGFRGGVFGEYDLGYSGLMLVPSLTYGVNGAHVGQSIGFPANANFSYNFSDSRIKIYNVQLPINLEYGYRVSQKFKVFAGVGVYVAKSISGTEKGNYSVDSFNNSNYAFTIRKTNNLEFNNHRSQFVAGQSNVQPIDGGFDILAGFQWKKLQISASYNRGFVQMYRTDYYNMGNQFWNFTVGYVLWGHERKPKL